MVLVPEFGRDHGALNYSKYKTDCPACQLKWVKHADGRVMGARAMVIPT
jgi:hypothetical protein